VAARPRRYLLPRVVQTYGASRLIAPVQHCPSLHPLFGMAKRGTQLWVRRMEESRIFMLLFVIEVDFFCHINII
jgi:hypothetical protein